MKFKACALAVALLASLPAVASPPSKVALAWNAATQTLAVTAEHYTLDPKAHFIKSVVVTVDGKEAASREFTVQAGNKSQAVEISLPGLKPGAVVVATAQCNLFGKMEGELIIK